MGKEGTPHIQPSTWKHDPVKLLAVTSNPKRSATQDILGHVKIIAPSDVTWLSYLVSLLKFHHEVPIDLNASNYPVTFTRFVAPYLPQFSNSKWVVSKASTTVRLEIQEREVFKYGSADCPIHYYTPDECERTKQFFHATSFPICTWGTYSVSWWQENKVASSPPHVTMMGRTHAVRRTATITSGEPPQLSVDWLNASDRWVSLPSMDYDCTKPPTSLGTRVLTSTERLMWPHWRLCFEALRVHDRLQTQCSSHRLQTLAETIQKANAALLNAEQRLNQLQMEMMEIENATAIRLLSPLAIWTTILILFLVPAFYKAYHWCFSVDQCIVCLVCGHLYNTVDHTLCAEEFGDANAIQLFKADPRWTTFPYPWTGTRR